MKRKALSPLITTILLIVVTFALIGIVLTWGKSFAIGSLGKTSTVSTSCNGAYLNIVSCYVTSDQNAILIVKNIGNTYTFPATDDFKISVVGHPTNSFKSDINMSAATTTSWVGLAPGATSQVNLDLNGNGLTGTSFDITVASSVCPSDSTNTFFDCREK